MKATYSSYVIVLASATMFAVGCGKGNAGSDIVSRPGEPDYVRLEDDETMDRAITKARETYQDFVAALEGNNSRFDGFAIKKPFPTPDGGQEHIWINEVRWDGAKFLGRINNEPVDTTAVKFGDAVTVAPEELSDWMYVDGNRLIGGFTVRVLHFRSSAQEQRSFTQQTGLTVPPIDF
jgi:uncharacterized protein YegJ (DUF2314 family)